MRLDFPLSLLNVRVGGERGRARRTEIANARVVDLGPAIAAARADGATSLREIAAALNARKIPTARGGAWSAVQVQRALARMGS